MTITTVLELTIISTEGLDNYTDSCFSPTWLRPFITLTKLPPTPTLTHVTSGAVDDIHKFRVPLDPTFFSDPYSSLYLRLFTRRRIVGPTQLGWCLIPASDIGPLTPGSVRYLSYRLRGRDNSSRGHAIINISIRLMEEHEHVNLIAPWISTSLSPTMDTCHTVIGIPVKAIRGSYSGDCNTSTNMRLMR